MTTATRLRTPRRAGLFRNTHRGQFIRFPTAVSLAELAALFLISAFFDLFDNGDVSVSFALAGLVCAGVAAAELSRVPRPRVNTAPAVFTMVTLSWVVLIAGAAVAHLLADVTTATDIAVFEGAATSTTTAMTSLDPATFPRGLHLFRALTQWIGGLGGLLVGLVVIPLVFGGYDVSGRGRSVHANTTLLAGRTRGVSKVLVLYASLTVILIAAYALAGLGAFDAVSTAMATASTGGLGTETNSLAGYSSAAVEWVAVAGMAVAGLNLGIVWWAIQRDTTPLARSSELKVYLSVLVGSVAAVAIWIDGSVEAPVRTAAVQVTSAMSTTGFITVAWEGLDEGVRTLLLMLVAIGSMAGSAGGGFRYLRVIEAFGFARREVIRQVHPTAVRVVRVDGRAVSERTLQRLNGYMVVFIFTSAVGAALVAVGDSDVDPTAAISLSLSALSTAGPHLGDTTVAELGTVSKLSLAMLMLLGRLSIYAVILTAFNAIRRLVQYVDPRSLLERRR